MRQLTRKLAPASGRRLFCKLYAVSYDFKGLFEGSDVVLRLRIELGLG